MSTPDQDGLKVVRHRVPIRRVAVPGFEREELSDLFLDELVGEGDAWVEALRLISANRDRLPLMKDAARGVAVENTWKRYRQAISTALNQLFS